MKTPYSTPADVKKLLKSKSGIRLDIGCGENKNKGFVGMDMRKLDGVDIVWDVEEYPWPLPDDSVVMAVASHLLEHINPHKGGFIRFMDEVWRVLVPDGQFAAVVPHGHSSGYLQDPTHCNQMNEACVTPDTEVLTYNGFMQIADITVDDQVLALDPLTRSAEYLYGCKLVSYDHDGSMVHFNGRAIDLLTNAEHRVWFSTRKLDKKGEWGFAEAETFLQRNPNTTVFSSEVALEGNGLTSWKIPEILPKHPGRATTLAEFPIDDFADFMGWYLSEGSSEVTEGKYYRVHIAQTKEENRKRIVECITRLGFHPVMTQKGIAFSAYSLSRWLKRFGHCQNKYIPRSLINAPVGARKRLFDSIMAGDGTWPTDGQFRYTSLSKRLANDVQVLAMTLGYRASVSDGQKTDKGKIVYHVHGGVYRPIFAKQFELVDSYVGKVHSLVMPKHHIYMARRNGKCVWTGNTWAYFDPLEPTTKGMLYRIYKPKPWKITHLSWSPSANMEVVLHKRIEDDSYSK